MKTIAEYVHSGPVYSTLSQLGIDYAQGFYLGRPKATPVNKTIRTRAATPRRRSLREA